LLTGEDEDDKYEIMKVQGSKFLYSFTLLDEKIRQRKLRLRDAIVIILAVSLSSL